MVTSIPEAIPSAHGSLLGRPPGDLLFRVCGSGRHGDIVRLKSPKCTVGSAAQCTLRIRARGVQPVHCLILRGSEGTVVRRLDARTRLNGDDFDDAPLMPGDRLAIGPIELEVLEDTLPTATCRGGEAPECAPPHAPPGGGVAPAETAPEQPPQFERLAAQYRAARRIARQRVRRLADRLREQRRQAHQAAEQARTETERTAPQQAAEWEALRAMRHELSARETRLEQERHALQLLQRQREEQQRTENDRLAAEQAKIAQERSELQRLRAQLEADRADLERERERLAAQEQDLAAQCEQFEAQCRQLDKRRAQLEAHEQQYLALCEQMEAERQQLSAQREQLEAQRRELQSERAPFAQQRSAALKDDGGPFDAAPRESADDSAAEEVNENDDTAHPARSADHRYVPDRKESAADVLARLGIALELEAEVEHPSPPAAPSPVPPPSTAPQTAAHEEEEESLDQYMARLLQRVRGAAPASAPSDSASAWSAPLREAAAPERAGDAGAPGDAHAPLMEQPSPPPAPRRPRPAPVELTSNLQEMRALANLNARAAVDQSLRRRWQRAATGKLAVTLVALIACLALGFWTESYRSLTFLAASTALLVMIFWGVQTAMLFRYLLAARQGTAPAAPAPPTPLPGNAAPCAEAADSAESADGTVCAAEETASASPTAAS